jgi:uncharacterized protein (TIGR00251 family)
VPDGGAATVRLAVKVVPGASRDGIAGWLGDALKVRVAAPPERGRANAAVAAVVAAAVGVSADRVRVVAGARSPRKTLAIDGVTEADVLRALGKPAR